jgi:hypothetical protein
MSLPPIAAHKWAHGFQCRVGSYKHSVPTALLNSSRWSFADRCPRMRAANQVLQRLEFPLLAGY